MSNFQGNQRAEKETSLSNEEKYIENRKLRKKSKKKIKDMNEQNQETFHQI